MTNKKSTKKALICSILALAMCFSMLVGTTFAWFTDSVTSGNNVIISGNLDVEFEYWSGTEWVDVNGKSDILTNTNWEPGVVEVAYLRVANAGSLAFKYQLGVNIVSETEGKNVANEPFKLSDYIKFGIVEDVNGKTNAYTDRADAVADVTDAKALNAGYTKAASMASGDELYLALVVWMPETVGNEANHNGVNKPSIDLGINIVATQVEAELDAFGPDYDKEAIVPELGSVVKSDGTAAAVRADKVTATIPSNAPAGSYVINVSNKNVETDANGNTTVAMDISLEKDGVKVAADGTLYSVSVELGKNLEVTAVTHNGNNVASFSYDPATGIVTFTTDSFSPFAFTYTEADADSVFVPSNPDAAEKLEKEGVIAVDENGNEYTNITDAVKSGASKLYCKEGADLGTVTHLDVANDLVIYGNGAYISGGEHDFAVDTYTKFTKDVTLTVYNLHGVAVWGQRNTEHTLTVNLYNCNDINRVYINGTSGKNIINLVNCTADANKGGNATSVYSNANGSVTVDGCTFTGISVPVNLNHKIAGEQTVTVTNTTFVDCATEGTAAYYAPIRVYNSVEGANQTLTVAGNTFTYSEGKAPINKADVLLNAKHDGVDAAGTIKATVQAGADVVCGVNVDVTFEINTAEELFAFAADVNKYSNYERPFEGQTVKLMNDIDLGGAEWTPIGDYRFSANRFCGTFDGQGHTISNFKITKKTDKSDSNKSSYGFFGNMEGTVKNLTIDKANVCSYAYVGALVGRLTNGTVENCHVTNSTVETTYWQAGGMIGQLNDACTVKGCTITNTTVIGASAIGGMFGPLTATNEEDVVKELLFENCLVKDCAIVQKGSIGASYDVLFGAMFNDIDVEDNQTDINNCKVENTTVKGVASDALFGVLSGTKVFFDGAQVINSDDALKAAIEAKAIEAKASKILLVNGNYSVRFTNNTGFNVDNMTIVGMGDNVNLSVSSSEAWYGRVQGSNVTFENVHFTSPVGATGKATYNNCKFDSWAICASSNNEKTYFNNCTINGCLNTSSDFSSGDILVKNCTVAKAEYSGSATMNFENCTIGELISWDMETVLTNCTVTTLDDSHMSNNSIVVNP